MVLKLIHIHIQFNLRNQVLIKMLLKVKYLLVN